MSKFVASHRLTDPSWAGTTVVTDVATEVAAIRDRFDEIHVIGSGDLVQKGAISLVYEPAGESVTGVDIADIEPERTDD